MATLAPGLYDNVGGHIACHRHAPIGTDSWEWEQWGRMPDENLVEFERMVGEPATCESCGWKPEPRHTFSEGRV